MNEHSLPEDLAQWPADPFELLGVPHGVSPMDLKRSYARLIQLYKPVRFPQQFRLIREAYEKVLRSTEIVPASPEPAADVPFQRPSREANPAFGEMDALWEQALRGEEAEAYQGLLHLHEAQPNEASILLRLYWLLSLDPQLDPTREPCDWLVDGLKSTNPHSSLLELYRREIAADPNEAISERFDGLLSFDSSNSSSAEFYTWRFAALRKLRRWDVLDGDLTLARERLRGHDQGDWLRLLLLVCDAAAWIPEGNTYQDLWELANQEVQKLAHLATKHGEAFHRLERLATVRQDWHRAAFYVGPPTALLDLVAEAWHAPFHAFRPALIRVLTHIDDDPERWLTHFDQLQKSAPTLLGAFAEALQQGEQHLDHPPVRPPAATVARLTREFLSSVQGFDSNIRMQVIDFCSREGLDPLWMVEAIVNNQVGWHSSSNPQVMAGMADDWPVRYVCQARRQFWS